MSIEATHEYIFLFTKSPRYWFDAEAVREPAEYGRFEGKDGGFRSTRYIHDAARDNNAPIKSGGALRPTFAGGRHVRTVWTTDEPQLHVAPLHNDRKEHMESGIYLDDGDVRLYLGDALETVRAMPDESVDCVVTSPPYWGLRDYGTGSWAGGDPECDHKARPRGGPQTSSRLGSPGHTVGPDNSAWADERRVPQFADVCGKCGATRVDRQMGLEPTPDLFVAGMVELFREIRRVLAPHGTCWVNMGDTYDHGNNKQRGQAELKSNVPNKNAHGVWADGEGGHSRHVTAGLKPKNLMGMPWRLAFGLQADGWILRSDIIWAKPNPMPESVTDRPTKAHEYVFLLTKQPRYWFDTEAVREPAEFGRREGTEWSRLRNGDPRDAREDTNGTTKGGESGAGRNVRSVWNIATQPYPEAHFATFPEELARRCILAGCPVRVCRVCGKPSERIVETVGHDKQRWSPGEDQYHTQAKGKHGSTSSFTTGLVQVKETIGWSDCGCACGCEYENVDDGAVTRRRWFHEPGCDGRNWRPGVVLDPFIGSGTVAKVARDHQRHAIGIDLNEQYLGLAARRLQQLSLLSTQEA